MNLKTSEFGRKLALKLPGANSGVSEFEQFGSKLRVNLQILSEFAEISIFLLALRAIRLDSLIRHVNLLRHSTNITLAAFWSVIFQSSATFRFQARK